MRKIFLIILTVFLWLFGYAQFPITQNLGAPSTLVLNRGGFKTDSALVIPSYSDTTRANQSLGKTYPGNVIRVIDTVYIRNFNASGWVKVGTGGGGGGGGSFDTVFAKYPIRVDTTGVKDTLYLAQPFLDSVYNNSPGFLDGLVSVDNIDLVDTSAIVVAPIIWKRNGVVLTQNTNSLFPIPRADTLKFRTDVIYINSLDSLVYLQGLEDTSNAIAPNIPPGGILITYVNVYGNSRIVNPAASNYQRTGVLFVDLNTGQITADSTRLAWNQSNGSLIIGNQAVNSNPSAILQLTSNNKGFLMPTMSAALRNGISSPANGLMVYDTDSSALFYYDNTQWVKLGSGSGTVTSVATGYGLSGGPITTSGTLIADTSVSGLSGKYLRIVDTANIAFRPTAGANIELSGTYPNITITGTGGSGGGSSINYYLNGSVNQGTFGGDTYYQLSQTPILGTGTNFTRLNSAGDGYIASFITDVGEPNIINIPGGNWNLEFYFNASSGGGSPQFYGEIYKYDGTTFTLIASNSTNPETISNGTTVDQYYTSIPIPQTTLLSSDRLAVRVYVITGGRNITLHTEDNNLSEVLTSINIPAWKTSGNADVNAGQFIGSTNNASLRFRTNNTQRMVLDSIGGMQMASIVNNGTLTNALQLANTDNRSFFNISTSSTATNLLLKANSNAQDSMIISDSGLIAPRSNATLWLKPNQTGSWNVMANRCGSCIQTGSIFAASFGSNAPVFNVLGNGQVSIGAQDPASTAALDITSTSRGLLIPRMTTSQRDAISTPASQLLVANTTTNTIDMYQNSNWSTIAGDYSDDVVAYRSLGSTIQAGPVPGIGTIQTAVTMFTGRGYWAAVYVKKPITITGAAWFQTIAGSYTAANYNGLALYSYSAGTLTLVDSSTRDNNIWTTTTGTWGSKVFAGGTRTLSPGIYYIAAIYNNSAVTTNPQIGAVYSGTSTVGYTAPLTTNSARISGWETSVTTPPTTKAMSSFSGQGIYLGLCLY